MVNEKIGLSPTAHFNSNSDFGRINTRLEQDPLDKILQWSLDTFGDKVAQVSSFGPTGLVILDHLAKLSPGFRVITIDTGFLFEETYALLEEIQHRYPIHLDIRRPALTPEKQARMFQPELWVDSPDMCCYVRKVAPLRDVLIELDAWMVGLRRDQSYTRGNLPLIGWDRRYELVKINPLINWTRGQVWKYILEHEIPYNPLHDQGYASVGCIHCTKPSIDSADERSGRWQGSTKIECGIHLQSTV